MPVSVALDLISFVTQPRVLHLAEFMLYSSAYGVNSFSPAAVESTDAVKRLPAPVPIDSMDVETCSQQTGSSLLNHEYS